MRTQVTVLMIALALTACAKKSAAPAASPGTNAAGSTPVVTTGFKAQMLGLDLTGPSSRDSAVPGDGPFEGGIAKLNPAYLESEVILRNTLHLGTTANGPFLTWPQGEGATKIASVIFAVRTQGTDNQLAGEGNYEAATPDHDGKRFFIPLHRALSRRVEDLGPADEQLLSMRVLFVNQEIFDLTLRFRVAGPLTPLQKLEDAQIGQDISGPTFMRSGSPVPIHRVTFQNPTQRHVALWLRALPEDLVFIGRFHHWQSENHQGDPQMHRLNWSSRMQMSELKVTEAGQSSSIRWSSNWSVIHFGPQERISVEWTGVSLGCGGTQGDIVGVSAEGKWAMDTWLTDASHPATPEEFQRLPATLSMDTGRIGSQVYIRTGDWDGFVGSGALCR